MSKRMLDFSPVWDKTSTFQELVADLSVVDLRELTNTMVDTMQGLIADAVDADVTFVPEDPEANDTFADDEGVKDLAWTLGHVIVHTTAGSEENAFLAAELARGVEGREGRSRYEIPWETVMTIAACRERLEESRRMRLASLDLWPDQPHLDNTVVPWEQIGEMNAIGRFMLGLWHDDSHLGQIAEIMRQAKG